MEESGLFLDLLVNCICVMHFIINREGLQGKVWGSCCTGRGSQSADKKGSREQAEWKELPSPVLCSPSDCRSKGHDRWLEFRALEDG